MREAIPLFPPYVFMAWYVVKHRDNFTFTFGITLQEFQALTYDGSKQSAEEVHCNY